MQLSLELGPEPLQWRKSKRSAVSGNCVEIARCDGSVYLRDSKDPQGMVISVTGQAFTAFLADIKAGTFDAAS